MKEMLERYFDRLWPICRSITGDGVRATLKILREIVPLDIHEAPTGKKVFDWEIPKEWNVRDAYIVTPDGKKVASFKENNLHLVSYSVPVNTTLRLEDLEPHLHYSQEMPDVIPYITSYYKPDWGFCLTYNQYRALSREGTYHVVIDTSLESGNLTYGDIVIPGASDEEILFSTYICHPSMANDNLSGSLVTAFLYKKIAGIQNRKYTYRFVFMPETIGAINYLYDHGEHLKTKLKAGYVVTCIGDEGAFTYKRSKRGDSLADRVAEHVLKHETKDSKVIDFFCRGSDERQYCSPGFNLPVGSLMRTMYMAYKKYHTSGDDKSSISFAAMEKSVDVYFMLVEALEMNECFINTNPQCEPYLNRHGLYPQPGAARKPLEETITRTLHLLTYADGERDLVNIADLKGESIFKFREVVASLARCGLIKPRK